MTVWGDGTENYSTEEQSYLIHLAESSSAQQVQEQVPVVEGGVIFKSRPNTENKMKSNTYHIRSNNGSFDRAAVHTVIFYY